MKNILRIISIIIFLPLFLQGQYTTVIDVYTDPAIVEGQTITASGYYTNSDYDLLIYFYGDFEKDRPFAPHTILTLTGVVPPLSANNGGYIEVTGIVTFLPRINAYNPEDTLMAFLNAVSIIEIFPGNPSPMKSNGTKEDDQGYEEDRSMNSGSCDSCKFAFLLSGGADAKNNHSKYWENLVALYKFKVDSLGYCESNVFVPYYKGTPRDGRIPAGRVIAADSAKIDSVFQVIANRVAACNDAGTPATLQKMITNHGESDGDICLLDDEVLKPDHLKDLQQKVIDSCCRTVYDEFLQCYGGIAVDAVAALDTKNKATIYANSNANDQCGYSPHNTVHPYLQAKINSLDAGDSYPDAVVSAKLAYDAYLATLVEKCHQALIGWRSPPPDPRDSLQIALWTADSIELANAICKSRNVTVVPFTHYCQWQQFVVPPGGQLKVKFEGKSNSCGNATVYKEDPPGTKTKVKEWNWNHPGSYRYENGNENRAINGDASGNTTFWIHNDNDTSRVTVEALGTPVMPESPSDEFMFPGFSFGGNDYSFEEFSPIPDPFYIVPDIDLLGLPLTTLPGILGQGFVQHFEFTFQIDLADLFWSEMELVLYINQVNSPDMMQVVSPSSTIPESLIPIVEPGMVVVPLGDFTQLGDTYGTIMMIPSEFLQFEIDSWGLRSVYGYPSPPTTTWIGEISEIWIDPMNWSDGVPGPYHHVIIDNTLFHPRIDFDVSIWSIEIMNGASVNVEPGSILEINGPGE